MWLVLLIGAIGALFYFVRHHYSKWERLHIPHEKPSIPFGALDPVRRQKRSFGLVMYDIYNGSKEKFVGIYLLYRPAILVRDAQLVRDMMTKNFASFHDRGLYVDEEHNPMSATLFSLRGQSWKTLRTKLAPSFSSGKLKGMFGTIDDVGEKLVKHLDQVLEDSPDGKVIEMKAVLTTYAVDVIGSVIFGLDIDSFKNPDNEFRNLTSRLFATQTLVDKILPLVTFLSPGIATVLGRLGMRNPMACSLRDIVERTINFRERNNVVRKDLLQLLIQLRNTGKISEDDDQTWSVETVAEGLKSMSIDKIAAQAFIFYIAGTETTAATAAFTIYELAMAPELLKKAQTEVEQCLERHNLKPSDKWTYEAIKDMKFLELCLMETIRKYPGLPFLNRECTEDFKVPDTEHTITKGTPIIISLLGIHRDPEYFPDPMKYDPERFLEENNNYDQAAYMPFGAGPRHCIAQRMGELNSVVAVAKLLANFNITPMERKEVEFIFHGAPVLVPKEGLNVRLSKKSA